METESIAEAVRISGENLTALATSLEVFQQVLIEAEQQDAN